MVEDEQAHRKDDGRLNRIWEVRKEKLAATLTFFAERSQVLELLRYMDLGDEIRAWLSFDVKTLVKRPNGTVGRQGPVHCGVRYHRSFLSVAPHPAELVQVLHPRTVYHPNVWPNGGMCLGHPPAGISMEQILHLTWAALTVNTRRVNTVAWESANPEAADYVRARSGLFPLCSQGLLERTSQGGVRPS